jgi:diacylglycerol kinase family enzyme
MNLPTNRQLPMNPPPNKTLIILNPHAAGGKAGTLWKEIEPLLWERLGELVVAITQKPEEVAAHLDKAQASGLNRVIAIGGDGTNHALINALADLNARNPDAPQMIYGNLPVGTGRDWARGTGVPYRDIRAAADWIAAWITMARRATSSISPARVSAAILRRASIVRLCAARGRLWRRR